MWAKFHGIDIRRVWAIPTWVAILGLFSLFITIPQNLWVISIGIVGVAFLVLLTSLLFVFPYKLWGKDAPLRKLRDSQIGNEQNWLYLVIDRVDLGTEGRQISIQFQIDSGLVYDFLPSRMWITLKLGSYRPEQRLHEMAPAHKLFKSTRNGFSTMTITVNDDGLLRRIESIRNGEAIEKELWIEIQPTPDKRTWILRGNF